MAKPLGIVLMFILTSGFSSGALAQKWVSFDPKGGISNQVTDIVEDRNGDLWIATFGGGAGRYDGGGWTRFSAENGLASNKVFSILEDSRGRLWFATDVGVIKYEGGRWTAFTTKDGLAGPGVVPILEDRKGNIWAGTASGVSRYDGTDWTSYTAQDFLSNKTQDIAEDDEGNLWFATYGGVIKHNGVSWITYNERSGLVSNFTTALIVDRKGNLWVGTLGGGLSRYNGASWATVIPAAPKNSETPISISDILEDRSGNIWVGVSGKGVMRYDGSAWVAFGRKDGLVSEEVNTLYEDRSGNLWVGTWEGISKLEGISRAVTITTRPLPPPVSKEPEAKDKTVLPSVSAEKLSAKEAVELAKARLEPDPQDKQAAAALKDKAEAEKTADSALRSRTGLGSSKAEAAKPAEAKPQQGSIERKASEKSKESEIASANVAKKKDAAVEEKPSNGTLSSTGLAVESAQVATGVRSMNPVGIGDRFPKDVGRIYLWSKIVNGAAATISHIWYYRGVKVSEVKLNISSDSFRTYSYKTISPSQVGDWRVEIVDNEGNTLKSLNFVVTD